MLCILAYALLAGCGGGAANRSISSFASVKSAEPAEFEDAAKSRGAGDSWPGSTRRVIQSIYFNSMDEKLAGSIGDEIKTAVASGKVGGLAFSPAPKYAATGRWKNALDVLDKCSAGKFILTVHFGHHSMEDVSAKEWGKRFYNDVFKDKWDKAYFILSPANEDDNTSRFDATMRELTGELLYQWTHGTSTKNTAFPYNRVRLCKYKMLGTSKLDNFMVEGEYHWKSTKEPLGNPAGSLPVGYSMVGNDGQTIAYPAYNPADGGALSLVSASKYNTYCKGLNASLWLPQLHLWHYDSSNQRYDTTSREDVPGVDSKGQPTGRRKDMLATIKTFMKTP